MLTNCKCSRAKSKVKITGSVQKSLAGQEPPKMEDMTVSRRDQGEEEIMIGVKSIGSIAIYQRVNRNLKSLSVDPFFFQEQVKLFIWRYHTLRKNVVHDGKEELAFLATQRFHQVMNPLDIAGPSASSTTRTPFQSQEMNLKIGQEAVVKFSVPVFIHDFLASLHPDKLSGQCECPHCKKHLSRLRHALRHFPASVPLAELLIRRSGRNKLWPESLQEQGMRRVLELGLPQDCLPVSLKKTLEKGPEARRLQGSSERMMERLRYELKELKKVGHGLQ